MNYEIIALIWIHFVADFMFQTDKIAIAKSSSNRALALHVAIYTLPFFYFGVWFALLNAALHFATDWCTSRATTYLWKKGDRHNFFVVIGLDQAIHMTCLLTTFWWMVA
jgi:hypothetical protein